ncbi:MAG: thioredoxin family protein [Aureispira sp.]|nr:thioredoxin family protein [Aureispira sp.]
MALTESNMLPLGTQAPDFTLLDTVSGKNISLKDLQSDKATLIIFSCNHCPYVIHVNEELVRLANDYQPKGVSFVAISSNDVENYPDDSPEKMTVLAKEAGYPFPYLYDETQEVAKIYDAACTPDFYLFDGAMNLAYRGRLDSSRPNSGVPVTGEDLRAAIDAVLQDGAVIEKQYPSAGCGIKWKK